MNKITPFKRYIFTERYWFVAVNEAGFLDKLHIKISSFFCSICSHVTRERSYFLAGFQQTCSGKEHFSRVENLYVLSHLVIAILIF